MSARDGYPKDRRALVREYRKILRDNPGHLKSARQAAKTLGLIPSQAVPDCEDQR